VTDFSNENSNNAVRDRYRDTHRFRRILALVANCHTTGRDV